MTPPSVGGTIDKTTAIYTYGDEVTLTATPATGFSFGEWTGDCAGQSNPCTLTVDGPKTVSASFTASTFTLTVIYNPTEGGGITAPAAGVSTYDYGTIVTVFPYPAPGYKFDHWTGSCSGTGNCALTMTANSTVTALLHPRQSQPDRIGEPSRQRHG